MQLFGNLEKNLPSKHINTGVIMKNQTQPQKISYFRRRNDQYVRNIALLRELDLQNNQALIEVNGMRITLRCHYPLSDLILGQSDRLIILNAVLDGDLLSPLYYLEEHGAVPNEVENTSEIQQINQEIQAAITKIKLIKGGT